MSRAALVRLGICVAMAGATVPTLLAGPAHACSCARKTDAEAFREARAVFTGTLIGREAPNEDAAVQSSADPVFYTFAVDRVYKDHQGRITDPQRVESVVDGASCGLELRGDGPFVIFTSSRPFDTVPSAGLCDGTRELAAGEKLPFGRGRAPAAASTAEPTAEPAEIPDTLGPTTDDEDDDGFGGGAAAGLGLAAAALVAGGVLLRRFGRN